MLKKIFRSIFFLFSEDGRRCSLGRVSFWMSFFVAMYIWIEKDYNQFPESLLWFLMFGYIYNTSKKLLFLIVPAFLAKKIPGYQVDYDYKYSNKGDNLSEEIEEEIKDRRENSDESKK